ncbi:MAG: hypothetical protein HUJ70_01365 [Pseudobutyrivibrio sp.]|nr:hypothetical protein [Pseudobutyrivibrio sp.]
MMQSVKAELNKMKEMDTQTRLEYFKLYYLKWTILFVFLLICFIWLLKDVFWGREDIAYAGGLCHVTVSDEGKTILTVDAKTALELGKKQVVCLTEDLMLSYAEGEEYNDQSTDVILFTYMAAGEYQYLLMDESVAQHIVNMDGFVSVEELALDFGIPKEDLLSDTDGFKTAFRIPKEVCENLGIHGETGDVYIGFVIKNSNDDLNKKFLTLLMG